MARGGGARRLERGDDERLVDLRRLEEQPDKTKRAALVRRIQTTPLSGPLGVCCFGGGVRCAAFDLGAP